MTDPSGAWRGCEVLVVSPTPTHPQDHGNRKRIFEICRELRRQGAKLHFVHYPGEHDWRQARPAQHEADMQAAWDSYQLVAPSRPLHTGAIGEDHEIDEWADPSLTHYLAWVSRLRRFDMAIVNYTWMSFALDALPASVFKVCDTHDVFGGRRELLQANGIGPEFFHTTRQGEAKGLARADLVWAIKESERVYFERDLGLPDTLTMLHAEPRREVWTAPPSRDGWLRAGVIGARNNVNRRNLEDFLAVALPILHRHMAPVKIVIAGGCSDDFKDWRHPNVEVLGRVRDVEDFYRGVDVVLAPMQFSTGLKIKVSEALASGAPLLAHAHAMEGYPTREPLHLLPSFEAMARELAGLAFDREPLGRLAQRSRSVCAAIESQVQGALAATRERLVAKLSTKICLVAPMEALEPGSLLHDHLQEAIDYIRFTAGLELYLTGAPSKPALAFLERYGLSRSVFVDPALHAALGEAAPEEWTPLDLVALLESRGYARAYLMADVGAELLFGMGRLHRVFVRHDAVEIAGGDADLLIDRVRARASVIAIAAAPARIQRWSGERGVEGTVQAPWRRSGWFSRLDEARSEGAPPPDVFMLAAAGDWLAGEVAAMAERLGARVARLDPAEPETAARLVRAPASGDPLAGLAGARLFIDMAPPSALSCVLGEAALRAGTPRLVFVRGAAARALTRIGSAAAPASVGALLRSVALALGDPEFAQRLREAAARELAARATADAGWTALWRLFKGEDARSAGVAGPRDGAEALFG